METTNNHPQFTHQEMLKALHEKRVREEANRRWREANPEKVAAIRTAYNKRKWLRTKEILKAAKEAGLA